MSTNPEGRAWVRVRADALRENYRRVRGSVGSDVPLIPMVKADAYGLGVAGTVRALASEEPWGWGVATLAEGLELRELGVDDPIVILTPLLPDDYEEATAARLQLTVSTIDALKAVAAVHAAASSDAPAEIHVDVDTGMGRTGFDWTRAAEWLPALADAFGAEGVRWVGCFTHLHSADEGGASVREQCERFDRVLEQIEEAPRDLLIHVLNSPGAFRAPGDARDAVRPGIFLYGGEIGPDQPTPEPVVSVHARVVHLRDAEPGTTLGYGATYRASGRERWATLSIGYGDGLPRVLGNRGSALLRGARVPIVGRISMDLTVVDISGVAGVALGDVATLVGTDGSETITLDEVADLAGTISYEILTGLSPRLPRVWTGVDGA